MAKRILLLSLAGVLVLGTVGVGAFWLFGRRGETPGPSASPDATPIGSLFGNPVPTDGPLLGPTGSPSSSTSTTVTTSLSVRVCPSTWTGQPDTDGDGLPDSVETTYHTNETGKDTDGDGFTDGEEVRNGYDPLKPGSARLDSDKDGLLEDDECTWKSDPFALDTDGDGFNDGSEVANGYNPTIKGDGKGSDRVATTTPSNGPGTTSPVTAPAAGLPTVSRAELRVIPQSSAEDIRAYLAIVDSSRPTDLTNGTILADALTNAFAGKPEQLAQVRARLKQFEQALIGTPTPERALAYHQLFISLTRYTYDQLGVIETTATTDFARAYLVAEQMENTLSPQVTELERLRAELDALAKGP